MKKPRLKFNVGLALISLQTTGPRFTNYFFFHPSPLLWCRDHAKVKHIYFAIIFFLTCFHMLRLHEKCFIICMLEVQKFVLVQILSLCQFVNNENIKNKIVWLNVGTSWVLQETPLKAAFKIPTWVEMLKDTDCDSLKQDRLPKNIWQWSFLFQYEISFYMDMEYQGEVLHLPVFCKRKRFCN